MHIIDVNGTVVRLYTDWVDYRTWLTVLRETASRHGKQMQEFVYATVPGGQRENCRWLDTHRAWN